MFFVVSVTSSLLCKSWTVSIKSVGTIVPILEQEVLLVVVLSTALPLAFVFMYLKYLIGLRTRLFADHLITLILWSLEKYVTNHVCG